jgi:hypothetical protein
MRLPFLQERWTPRRSHHMPERQHHAKIANEMADRLQRSADVPRWNKSERQTIEEWAEDHEMTFAQAIHRLVELGLSSGKRSK